MDRAESSTSHAAPHIVFAGGVTGGHFFPGLAVADELLKRLPECRLTFAGTGREFERSAIGATAYEYVAFRSAALQPAPIRGWRSLVAHTAGYLQARAWLQKNPADVIVGMGGYGSVPIALAAVRSRAPLVILEQNVLPGRANRLLSRWATTCCLPFSETAARLRPEARTQVTGVPVRAGSPRRLTTGAPQLLVLGGSLGSQSLNALVAPALADVRRDLADWKIIHQVGGGAAASSIEALYRQHAVAVEVTPFIGNLPGTLAVTDLAISRAGGVTLAELSAAGVPSILVPLASAAENHQLMNARHFASAGAAEVIETTPSTEADAARLADAIRNLIRTPERSGEMSVAMQRLAKPNAARDVAAVLETVIENRKQANKAA